MADILELRRLTLAIGERTLVRDLDAHFRTGETWAMLGANGCGKTTLLHALAGLRPAQRGEIRLNGAPLGSLAPRERARALGVLFQDGDETFPATVLEHVLTGRHPHRARFQLADATDAERARLALRQMDLAGFEQRWLSTLSGGERRRVELATLLVQEPAVLLMDEPTNHLDLRHQTFLMRHVLGAGQLRVIVMHDVNLARRFCTHALLLFGDGTTLQGAVAHTITRANLERLYACPIDEVDDGRAQAYLPG